MFTKREIEIICLIARGLKSQVLADKLFVSSETVKSHRKNIRRKVYEINKDVSLREFCIQYAAHHEDSPPMAI
jgi:DNA-binding CsgD family transcriptional regulator